MRRVVCVSYGEPEALVVEEAPDLEPSPGRVLVDVHACGVNYTDALLVAGRYQIKPPVPFVPGLEAAGVVRSSGMDEFTAGDRVIVNGIGMFASQVSVPPAALTPVPDGMPMAEAAAFTLVYATTLYGLRERGALRAGETLLVLGASGGIGTAAIDLGKGFGATVIAAASSDAKLDACREAGADMLVNYEIEDLKTRVRELTGGRGADVVYDPVGGAFSEPALRATAWEGRFLVIGFAAGEIPRLPANVVLLRGCQVVGVDWGGFQARDRAGARRVLDDLGSLYREGRVHPRVTKTYPLEDAALALREVLDRRAVGKLALVVPDATS